MKKYQNFLLMALFATLSFSIVSCGGGRNSEYDSAQVTTSSVIDGTPIREVQPETINTKKGEELVDKILEWAFKEGSSEGNILRQSGYVRSNPLKYGTEEYFKNEWYRMYGIPNDSKAKDVYNQAFKEYQKGYKEALSADW